MIVRISGEDQYRLDDSDAARLNELEQAVLSIVEGGHEDGFGDAYSQLLEFVRAHGTRLGEDELASSDVILPPADITFDEATKGFSGEGLIPE